MAPRKKHEVAADIESLPAAEVKVSPPQAPLQPGRPWVDFCPQCERGKDVLERFPPGHVGPKVGRVRCTHCRAFELAVNVNWKD